MTVDPVMAQEACAPLWRRLVGSPLLWSGVLALAAAPWYLGGKGMDLLPFLLTLVSGFLAGSAFVSAASRTGEPVPATVVHVAGAVAAGLLLFLTNAIPSAFLASVPETARALFFEMRMGLVPAAGWVWVTLVARITALIARGEARRRPPGPDWEGDGEGAVVRFTAVSFRARTYAVTNGLVGGAMGVLALALVLAAGGAVIMYGPRMFLFLLGLVCVLPVYLVFWAALRRRTVSCAVRFLRDRLRFEVDGVVHDVAARDLELLRWRSGTEFARIEARARNLDLVLVVGMARPADGLSPDLPPLSRRMRRVLEVAGLVEERGRNAEVLAFQRAPAAERPRADNSRT